jgi:hypothetical protein
MQDRFLKWTGRLVNDRLQSVALSRLKSLSPFRIVDRKVFVDFDTLFYYLPKFLIETSAKKEQYREGLVYIYYLFVVRVLLWRH